ncbi:DUF2922 domain-containing protein [Metabacillus halosaccharovorans]|uniref:DUF2922 family protein n=1 Tax=Metabacillus halosaccharovorans TaxID=930124 RepID=UPI00403D5E14
MAKTLELQFLNVEGKTVKMNVDSPIEPVDPVAISAAMDSILTAGGEFVSKKGARIVERNVTEVGLS